MRLLLAARQSAGPLAAPAQSHRRLPLSPTVLALLLASGLSVACGGNQDALKREVSSLREQVTSLQGAQDHLEERLMAMEAQRSKAPRAAEAAEEPEQDERPRLKVVRLSPSDSEVGHDEADEAPHGSSAAAR